LRRSCGFGSGIRIRRERAEKKTGRSNFQTSINDHMGKEIQDRTIDPSIPGMPVEKLGRNSASGNRNWEGRERERKKENLNSRVTEFSRDSSNGIRWRHGHVDVIVSTTGAWIASCYIRDWQLSTVARPMTMFRFTDGSSLNRVLYASFSNQSARLPIMIVRARLSICSLHQL